MSLRESPPQSCVDQITSTLLYTLLHSGWWFFFSLCSATQLIQPQASLKFWKVKVLVIASLPSTMTHPAATSAGSSTVRSSSVSFCNLVAMVLTERVDRSEGRKPGPNAAVLPNRRVYTAMALCGSAGLPHFLYYSWPVRCS